MGVLKKCLLCKQIKIVFIVLRHLIRNHQLQTTKLEMMMTVIRENNNTSEFEKAFEKNE
jgi:hypothetical protein